jgi:glycosyltransferase involved in cell wall biosynthesis
VSDYTRLVAERLAALGDEVTVYAPPPDIVPEPAPSGLRVIRLPDHFGVRGLRRLDWELSYDPPDRVLIQYVPHAFGMKAMNLLFAAWVAARASRIAPVWVMFHEVAYPFVRRPLRHNLLAVVNRVMARAIAGTADRVMVSVPSWGPMLERACPGGRPAEWLPVPCNVATAAHPEAVADARSRYAPGPRSRLIGHFGTFGSRITDLLEPAVVGLMRAEPLARVVLIGRRSERFLAAFRAAHPDLAARVNATGELSAADVAAHLQACDILLQPYADGVSSRRGSVMAGLANRVAVVTNLGALSEPLWVTSSGATVVPGPDAAALVAASIEVLALPSESRLELGARGAALYYGNFTLERTVSVLHDSGQSSASTRRPTFPKIATVIGEK